MRSRLTCIVICLFVALATLASCGTSVPLMTSVASDSPTPIPSDLTATAKSNQPSAAEVAAAEAELADYGPGIGTSMLPKSPEDLVSRTAVIVVAKVTAIGPIYNSSRDGESGEIGPSTSSYTLAQMYVVQVERYLKGSGPETIRVGQAEGALPDGMSPTPARLQVARTKYQYTPMQVGSRYLSFLNPPVKVPELGNIDFYPPGGPPHRFLLSPDGNAAIEGVKDAPDLDKMFPKGPEKALISKIEKAIADQKK